MIFLFILQNAYRSDKYNFRNEDEWFRDLNNSHTGRRLKEMLPDIGIIKVVNASPIIGNDATSCYMPDVNHIKTMIERYKPHVICACGAIAQQGCKQLGIEFISLPHPAWRKLSKELTFNIKKRLENL